MYTPGIDEMLAVARVTTGAFFAISGYHKLFNVERHAALVATLEENKVPFVRVNQWWVPLVEFVMGTFLVVGLLTSLSALMLFAVCVVATCTDGCKRVRDWHPLDKLDCLDDFLYLPEVLLAVLLLMSLVLGSGFYSLDKYLGLWMGG